MTTLLIHHAARKSVADALSVHGSALDVLSMDDAGVVTRDGTVVDDARVHANIAWLSGSLFVSGATRPFLSRLFMAHDLQWVQSAAAGYDHPLFGNLVKRGAKLSTSHVHSEPIADYVMAGVLDYFQRGPERRAQQANRIWRDLTFREVTDSRWLIVGFGSIGQAVARRARAFGAEVVGVRRRTDPHPLAERIVALDRLAAELPGADVVVLCAPSNADTRQIVDERFLSAMTPGSVLVNVGRGALVNEPDLLAALDRGVPARAVLDVFETEPLPADSRFWGHPRVSLTAHTASETPTVDRRNAALFIDNLQRFLAGEPLLNLADPADVLDERP